MYENNQIDNFATVNEVKQYLYFATTWTWLIVLVALLSGGVAFYISSQTTPIYQTSTRLLVSDPPAVQSLNYSGIVNGSSLTGTYAKMLVDRPVLQGVIEQLNLPMTSDELKPLISVDIISGTQLLSITVDNTNPIQAADIANTIADVFTQRIRDLQAQRYSATRDGLAQRVSDMEKKVSDTSNAITAEKQALGIPLVITPSPNGSTISAIPESPLLIQLESRLTEYQRLYSGLVTNYEQVRLAEAQTSTNVFVAETASVPRTPISPNTSRTTLLAAVVGAMMAAGLVFIIEYLDDTIKNPQDIRRKFNLPVLGMISHHSVDQGKPISVLEPRSPVVEAYRTLRTNITFAGVDIPLRKIIITSSVPQEGKSTVAANLAAVLAQGDKKVILIDADLRRPTVHTQYSLPNRLGLTTLFVRQGNSLNGVIQATDYPQLSVITSGGFAPNPSELLTSKKMAQLLDYLREESDMVILDTPPVLTVTDAAAMASVVDGIILVAKPGVTKVSMFAQTIEQLHTVGANILGVVLNDVKPNNRKYGYYYARYYSKDSDYYHKADEREAQKK